MGPCILPLSLLSLLAFANGGQFSQRLDTPIATYGWTPLVPVSTRSLSMSQNGRVYTTPYQDNSPQQVVYQQASGNGANVDAPRQFSASSPQSRTVTASITWPPPDQPGQGQQQPQPQPEPQPGPAVPPQEEVVGPGLPDEDIAAPETDPPVLETFNGRPEDDRVVKTTLKTPVSHGYVVALVKKPHHLKSYFKSKIPGAVRDDQPAFFVYVPPKQRGNVPALQSRVPQLRANNGGASPRQYQRPFSRTSAVPRYFLPFFGQPFALTDVQGLSTPAVPAVLVYVPPEGQFSAPLPASPSLSLLEHSKSVSPALLSKAFLDSAAPPDTPWFSQSLESPPEEIIKLTLAQMGKFRA